MVHRSLIQNFLSYLVAYKIKWKKLVNMHNVLYSVGSLLQFKNVLRSVYFDLIFKILQKIWTL